MAWEDGSGVPTSGRNLTIVGTDKKGRLHIRIFDGRGKLVTDADETQMTAQAAAIASLKQELPSLSPPRELTVYETARVIGEVKAIAGQTQPSIAMGDHRDIWKMLWSAFLARHRDWWDRVRGVPA
jgi:hypothetical protein